MNLNEFANLAKENVKGKKSNLIKTGTLAALVATAGISNAQNSATIDPKYYQTPSSPFVIPNLPSGSDFFLGVKAGEKIYLTVDGIDPNTATYYINDQAKTISGNVIELDGNDVGSILINYKRNGSNEVLSLKKNNQADIYDRTPGSSTQNQRPEVVMVDEGQSGILSAGSNINPTGGNQGFYGRQRENGSRISTGYADSTKTVTQGTYIVNTADVSGLQTGITKDTISVIERPTANSSARTLNFAATVNGVIYKVYKFQPAAAGAPMSKAPSESAVDSAWVEIPSLSFVGDGNPHSVGVELGTYRIGAQRTANTDEVQDTKSIKVDIGTDVLDVNNETKNTFRQANRELSRETEVPSIIYDIHGREMGTALASTIRIPDQATAGIYIVRFTENGKIHTKKIIIK